MKNKLLMLSMFIAIFLFSLKTHSLSLAKTYPYSMDKNEHILIETASCKKHNSKITFLNAYKYKVKSKEIFAYVECIGEAHEGKLPVYIEHCDKNKVWKCKSAGEGYQVEINSRKVNLILNGVSLELAQTTLSKISNSWFQSRSIDELIGKNCTVSYAESNQELEYDCGWNARITVSLFCPTDFCPRVLWIN